VKEEHVEAFIEAVYKHSLTGARGALRARVSRAWAIALHDECQRTTRRAMGSLDDLGLSLGGEIAADVRRDMLAAEREAQVERAKYASAPSGSFVFTLFGIPVYLDDSVDGLVVEADPTPGEAQMGRLE
jgi:hypothetical protein